MILPDSGALKIFRAMDWMTPIHEEEVKKESLTMMKDFSETNYKPVTLI